jgi:hypothetical protein
MPTPESSDDRLLVPRPEARRLLGGIGQTKLTELETARQVEVVRIGRRTLITTASIRAYVNRLRKAK